ncbi:MAG: translation initiation factor IF-2 subunit beta [Nanoarchaeota archaeon]
MADGYEALLKRARHDMPESISSGQRFEMPKVHGHIQGNRTVLTNFLDICGIFRRDPQHVIKYLQRELATPAQMDGPRLILGSKLNPAFINSKIEKYANEFVLCYDCKKPDTQLITENNILIIKCTACGAKHNVKAKI